MHRIIHFFKAKSDYVTTVTPITGTELEQSDNGGGGGIRTHGGR